MQKEIAGVVRINLEGQPRFRPSEIGIDAFTIKPGDKLSLENGTTLYYINHHLNEGTLYPRGRLLQALTFSGKTWEEDEIMPFNWGEVCGVIERPIRPAEAPNLTINLIEPSATAPDLLNQAAKHMADRAATYDKPGGERSMAQTVQAFNAIRGKELTEAEGWLLLTLLKFVRDNQRQQPHRDSIEDAIAYAALYGEARLQEGVAP